MPCSSSQKFYLTCLAILSFASEQCVDFADISVLVINERGAIVEYGLTRKNIFLKTGNVLVFK
jgi:hypothetical protein